MRGRAFLTSLLLLVPCAVDAKEKQQPWTFTAYFENDLFADTDQSYTNGVRFSWISPDISSYEHDPRLPSWVRTVNDQLRFFHGMNAKDCGDRKAVASKCLNRNLVISAGQLIFTPEDPHATEVIQDDRPYAGYLYTTFGYHTRTDLQLDTIEFSLGIVGPDSYAKETQDFIHDLRGIEKFRGWDNQLHNEPVVQVLYEHKRRFRLGRLAPDWNPSWLNPAWRLRHDFITHFGGNFGNAAIYANTGFEYRIGLGLPEDFGSGALRPGGDNAAPGRRDTRTRADGTPAKFFRETSFHLFASFDGRAVGRDIFLDGNTFRDSHSVNKKYVVGDVSVGFGLIYHRWKFSMARVWRSQEYDDQQEPHVFGSVSLSYSY